MTAHMCLICLHSHDFEKPMSMTTGGLHMSFNCLFTPYLDAEGNPVTTNAMIYDMLRGRCWVDGGAEVPVNGCINYKKYNKVQESVIDKFFNTAEV
jgi:hypothetical protein